ncbi:hypothetical protein [Nonomuraea insulae]|uniref:Uncharacterized protein n=1 Tax=Nonomuraea insulae TaxID=1616787 RepID=A0ABW1CPA7_9ACTN
MRTVDYRIEKESDEFCEDQGVGKVADALIHAADRNGDELSAKTIIWLLREHGFQQMGEVFAAVAPDGDEHTRNALRETFTHDEFRTAIEEFYLSTDTEAPGNWLLGSPLTST